VDLSALRQSGNRTWPAITPSPTAAANGSAQTARPTSNGAYSGLIAVNDSSTWVMTSNQTSGYNPPAPWSSGTFYGSLATLTGDLTGNGQSDLVAVNGTSVWVMLSSGGSFQAPELWSSSAFSGTRAILLADVSGNGRADLVAVNDNSVWVMLSTGSGFAAPVEWSSGAFYGSQATLAADVNGDGKSDLVAVNRSSTWVMTSNGFAFNPAALWSSSAFFGSQATLAADVSGDGKADLIAVNGGSTWVMPSTGTAFGTPALWSSSAFYGTGATLAADVNGDGMADLIAVNGSSTWVMTSNGSEFNPPAQWSSSAFYGSRATLAYPVPASPIPLLVTTTSLPTSTVGTAYLTTLAASGGTTPYSWEITSGSLPAGLSLSSSGLITGTPSSAGSAAFTVQVTDASTPSHKTASAPLSITVAVGSQTITFTSAAPSSATVGGATYTAAATATSGLLVTFTSATATICTVSSSTVSFIGAGTCSIDANQAGDANYNAASQVTQSFTVSKLGVTPQTISFTSTAPTDARVGSGTYTPTAAATSTLPVTLTIDATSAGCALASGVVSFTAVGTCVIDANQAGNGTYKAAPEVKQSFNVMPPPISTSSNWSGYIVGSGPYTSVTGTFTVPAISPSPANTDTAEWVGIDGATNSDLIQAGIDEPYSVIKNSYMVVAWWEILPAYATPITMNVSPGDSVTVTISQLSPTLWAITLTDNTTSQTFATDQTYTGPLTSAEWIVEAPTDSGSQSLLGDYIPDVTFTNLGITGAQKTLTESIMVQGGVQVSTPSSLTGIGFNVAYGDVAPPPP
jgi:hypothetical protein